MWPARPTRAWSIAVAVLLMIRLKWSKLQWARGQLGGRWRRCSGCYGGSVESASVRKRLQRSLYRRYGGLRRRESSLSPPPGRLEGPRSPSPEALLSRADILPGRPPAATSGAMTVPRRGGMSRTFLAMMRRILPRVQSSTFGRHERERSISASSSVSRRNRCSAGASVCVTSSTIGGIGTGLVGEGVDRSLWEGVLGSVGLHAESHAPTHARAGARGQSSSSRLRCRAPRALRKLIHLLQLRSISRVELCRTMMCIGCWCGAIGSHSGASRQEMSGDARRRSAPIRATTAVCAGCDGDDARLATQHVANKRGGPSNAEMPRSAQAASIPSARRRRGPQVSSNLLEL